MESDRGKKKGLLEGSYLKNCSPILSFLAWDSGSTDGEVGSKGSDLCLRGGHGVVYV